MRDAAACCTRLRAKSVALGFTNGEQDVIYASLDQPGAEVSCAEPSVMRWKQSAFELASGTTASAPHITLTMVDSGMPCGNQDH